jgi:excinuclease ABC subunit C
LDAAWGRAWGLVSEEEYAQQVDYVRLFLAGKDDQVLTQLIARMEKASAALEFEEAARIRDQIQAVRRVTEKQFVSNTGDDLDVIGVAFDAGMACVHVLFIRQGKVLGSRSYFPKVPGGTELGEVVETFVGQFYLQGARCARCLLRSCSILILTIKPCWPIRSLNWRGVGSMYKPNRAAIVRVI